MSVIDFLQLYEGYKLRNFTLEYTAIEAKKYYCFGKFRVAKANNPLPLLVRMRSSTDNNMLKFFRLKIVEEAEILSNE